MSVGRLSSADFLASSVFSFSTPAVLPGNSHFLEREAKLRFFDFFLNRTYCYEAHFNTESGEMALQFDLPLIDFLKACVDKLREENFLVSGVFLKGGAVRQILSGSKGKLSDLDLTIQIENISGRGDYDRVEQIFQTTLWMFSGIYYFTEPDPKIKGTFTRVYAQGSSCFFSEFIHDQREPPLQFFSWRGAVLKRKVVFEQNNSFSLQTIPTFFQGVPEKIDIQFLNKTVHSCFSSGDAVQINMTSFIDSNGSDHENLEVPLRAVDGYDLENCMELKRLHLLDVQPREGIGTIWEGLRGYCHILSKLDDWPVSMDIEDLYWEKFIKDYKPTGFSNLLGSLECYLEDHYSGDLQGKIVYLLNYYYILQRCCKNLDEKNKIEAVIFDGLSRCLGELKDDYTTLEMGMAIEFASYFLFLRSGAKKTIKDEKAFFLVERGQKEEFGNNYLFCSLPDLQKERNHPILCNKLLQKLALEFPYEGNDLAEFFSQNRPQLKIKKIKKTRVLEPPSSVPPPLSPVEKCFSTVASLLANDQIKEAAQEILSSGLEAADFIEEKGQIDAWVREISSKLLEKKQVDLSVKLTCWAIEQNILCEPMRNLFLHAVLKGLCAEGSVKKALVVFRLICARKQRIDGLLSAFEPFDMDGSDLSKLLEIIGLAQKYESGEIFYDSLFLLFLTVLNRHSPLLLQAADRVLVMSLERQRKLFFDLMAQLPPKIVFPFFKALYSGCPEAPFLGEIEVLASMLPEFFKTDKSAAVAFYLRQEPSLLQSDSYFAIYQIFCRGVVSLRDEKIDIPLVNGLVKLEQEGIADGEILAVFNLHHEFFLKKKKVAEQLKKLLEQRKGEDFKVLKKALGLPTVKSSISKQEQVVLVPKKMELSYELVERLKNANGFVRNVIYDFFSLNVSITEEKIKAMDEQIGLVCKHFTALEKEATDPEIHLLHIHVLITYVAIKKEQCKDYKALLDLKKCIHLFKDALERDFLNLDCLGDQFLWGGLARECTACPEGFDVLFGFFTSIEDRNKVSFSDVVRLRVDILQAAIASFHTSKDMLFMKLACQHLDALSSLLAKHISKTSCHQWDKTFQFLGEIAEIFTDVGWDVLCPDTPGADIDRSILTRGKKMFLSSFDKVIRHSDLENAYNLSFDMRYLKNLRSIARKIEDELGEGFFLKFYLELEDRLQMCWVSEEFLQAASVEELRAALEKSNKLAISLRCLDAISLKDPENEQVWVEIAEIYMGVEAWDQALRAYNIASSKNPQNREALIGLGKVYLKQEKWNDAYAIYANLRDSNPESERLFLQDFSFCCYRLEMYKEALSYSEKAAELHPDDPVVLTHRADCYYKLNDLSHAIFLIEAVCDRYPSYPYAFFMAGNIYVNEIKKLGTIGALTSDILDRWRKVKRLHGRYNQLAPNNAPTLCSYGAACFNLDEWEEAFTVLSRSYELNRDDKACLTCLAECHSHRKEPQLAVEKISRAIQLEAGGNSEVCLATKNLINLMIKRAFYCLESPTSPERIAMAQQDVAQVKSTSPEFWRAHLLLPLIEKKLSKYKKL